MALSKVLRFPFSTAGRAAKRGGEGEGKGGAVAAIKRTAASHNSRER